MRSLTFAACLAAAILHAGISLAQSRLVGDLSRVEGRPLKSLPGIDTEVGLKPDLRGSLSRGISRDQLTLVAWS